MKALARVATFLVGLVLFLTTTPSWGQPVCAAPGCNPTTSDGNQSTAGGSGSLQNVVTAGNPQAFSNTAFGNVALHFNTLGIENTAIGNFALVTNTIGSSNTAIGHGALLGNTTGNFNTATGVETNTFIAGIGTSTVSGAGVMIDTTSGQLGVATSSARYRRDIETMANRSEGLLNTAYMQQGSSSVCSLPISPPRTTAVALAPRALGIE